MLIIEPTNEELPSGILKAENIVAAVLWSIIRICDYTEENGPTHIWPGTHKTLRILCKSGAYCDPTLYEPMLAEWPVKSALRISSCFPKGSAIAYTALESGPTKTLAVQASSLHS